MPEEQKLLSDMAIDNIKFDIANSKPSSSPMGLFRQHCEDLLAENTALREQLAQTETARDQLSSGLSVRNAQLAELQSQLDQYREQFRLLDDPQGLYSEARERIVKAVRDACVEKVKARRDKFQAAADASSLPNDLTASRDAAVAAALTRLLGELESLTLDQVEQKKR